MEPLEKEILKYEKKGFKISQKRSLKYGSRIYLVKKGGFLGTNYGVYMYYVNGDCTTDSLRECFNDYVKFYEKENFEDQDIGFLFCSGSFDEKLFKDLRKGMISEENIRNSIKLIGLEKTTPKKEVENEKSETKVRKATEEGETQTQELTDLIEKIKRFRPHKMPQKEKELENMLVSYLSAFYSDIKTQLTYEKATIDVKIGDIGIEIKYRPSASELDRLYGQVDKYSKYLDSIVVFMYEKSKEDTESFQRRLKERGWLNSKVFLITIR